MQAAHCVDSPPETNANRCLHFIKIESEPFFDSETQLAA